jgi:hypothetical protein
MPSSTSRRRCRRCAQGAACNNGSPDRGEERRPYHDCPLRPRARRAALELDLVRRGWRRRGPRTHRLAVLGGGLQILAGFDSLPIPIAREPY